MTTILTGSWNYPTRVLHGPGRIEELAAACREAGMSRPLLVTDEGLKDAPMIAAALESLKAKEMGGVMFAGVKDGARFGHTPRSPKYIRSTRSSLLLFFGLWLSGAERFWRMTGRPFQNGHLLFVITIGCFILPLESLDWRSVSTTLLSP